MSEPPRRGPVSTEERLRNLGKGVAGSPQQGTTRYDRRPVARATLGVLRAAGLFALVIHGDDPDVPRPGVLFVYWVGAATPSNGAEYDWWYTADV